MPPNVVHGFQPSCANPKKLFSGPTPTTSAPRASIRSGRDLAEHLERLGDLHRRSGRIEAERLTEQVDRVDVHPRRRPRAEVERNTIGLGMREGALDPLA